MVNEDILRRGINRSFDIAHLDEPIIDQNRCDRIDYVRLEDLCVGDILSIKGDKDSHPSAKYLVEIAEVGGKRVVRIWNRGRGPYCFIASFETINYYSRKERDGELGALKVGATSTWPYFRIHGDGLQHPSGEDWTDYVGEILLQRVQNPNKKTKVFDLIEGINFMFGGSKKE